MIELIEPTVVQFANFLMRYFVALAAVGALAMALMELWKKIRHSQTRYHAKWVTAWMQSAIQAYAQLIHLTVGMPLDRAREAADELLSGNAFCGSWLWVKQEPQFALFALPLERMVAHIQSAADTALNNPGMYPELFRFMVAGAGQKDVDNWLAEANAPLQDRDAIVRRADRYSRLQQFVRHKLSSFQLYTEQRWANWNQLWANITGAVVLFVALVWIGKSLKEEERLGELALVVLSTLGGILSPVAKDVVAALRKVREGA